MPPPPGATWRDSAAQREAWFERGLQHIGALAGGARPRSLAFPEQIGCGLGGGDWPRYEAMIEAFAARHSDVAVAIVRLADGGAGAGRGGRGGRGGGWARARS